jgi:uncharacterized SAM-binding protein YcdF (DUF218 family)
MVTDSLGRLRELKRRVPLVRLVEGAATGVAMWCILFAFQLLPNVAAETPGVLLFGIVGLAVGVTPLHRVLLVILAIAAGAVVVVTQTTLSNVLASHWIRDDQFPDSSVQAVVVLSAGLNPNATINGEALDHLITGIELVRAGKAPLLVTTTVRQRFPGGVVVTSTMDQSRIIALLGAQVLWSRTQPGRSTRDEALRSADLLLHQGIRRIAVVTSPMHTRRACAAFRAAGFTVTCVPARVRSPGSRNPGDSPADRIKVFGDWVYEVIATAKYRANGWLEPATVVRGNPSQ